MQDGPETEEKKILVHVDAELREIVPGFLENRRNDIQALLRALEQKSYGIVRTLGHRMKGSGTGYGFEAISDIGNALEKGAEKEDAEEVRKWVKSLATYMDRIEIVYGRGSEASKSDC